MWCGRRANTSWPPCAPSISCHHCWPPCFPRAVWSIPRHAPEGDYELRRENVGDLQAVETRPALAGAQGRNTSETLRRRQVRGYLSSWLVETERNRSVMED